MQRRSAGLNIPKDKGFTLIELLVVIAIIAILAVVVVLTLNPAQLLAQSRDANRVSDMATLNSAITLYSTDQGGASTYSLGTATTSYLSTFDTTATSTAGDQCQGLGIASSGYAYHCAASSSYRNASTTGWVPIAFNAISSGAPFGSLPVDPVNQTSTNLYYSYLTNGATYALSAFMESQKYAKEMDNGAGIDPALYQIGSGVQTLPDASRGLVGYWPLNEGSGSSTIDWSGNGNNGSWTGTATGTSGYYSPGKLWQWAGAFDGTTTYIGLSSTALPLGSAPRTLTAWIDQYATGGGTSSGCGASSEGDIFSYGTQSVGEMWRFTVDSGYLNLRAANDNVISTLPVTNGTWEFVAAVYPGGTSVTLYLNNSSYAGTFSTQPNTVNGTGPAAALGASSDGAGGGAGCVFNGLIGDVRVYDRALSAAEIQEIYNAEK